MHAPKVLVPALAALAAVTLFLASPSAALANGGDVHFGALSTGLSPVAFYGVAGFMALVVLLFVASWVRLRREQARGARPSRRGEPPRNQKTD